MILAGRWVRNVCPSVGVLNNAQYIGGSSMPSAIQVESRQLFLDDVGIGEIMGLEWGDVDFRWSNITIRSPKNNETRHIPMNRQVKDVLQEIQQEEGKVFINPDTRKPYRDVRKAMRRALDKATVKRHIRFHDLRHTTGSHLAMSGATEREIGEVLGHKDPKMSRRYSHLSHRPPGKTRNSNQTSGK
jgi:integrase